jgi:hypothetical protein
MTRKGLWTLLGTVALVAALSVPAQAFTLDTLLGQIVSANSGQAYEEAQLEAAIGGGVDITLLSNVTSPTVQDDGAGHWYIDVAPSEPGYFLLKFGTGNTGNDMFFFQNIAELTKLVWSDSQLIAAGLPTDHVQSISHYAITSSTTTVPEPGTLTLLGSGLIGMVVLARRRLSKKLS